MSHPIRRQSPAARRRDDHDLTLGDILQRLARLEPRKVDAITLLARDALRLAERRFRQRFGRDPYTIHPDWKRNDS